ncbi:MULTISPECIES: hypothetical protein [unclassified Streptomyces]|uniref:hypothetical protein n=1 Tax=unclassified Streptomyces TaxID=2593676 RepID=UPI003D89E2E9
MSAGDVYAAACLFQLCLTGRLPFPVRELLSLMARHVTAAVPPRAVARPLRAPLCVGLAKGPVTRPGADDLAAEVEWAARAECGPDWERLGQEDLRVLADNLPGRFFGHVPGRLRRHAPECLPELLPAHFL